MTPLPRCRQIVVTNGKARLSLHHFLILLRSTFSSKLDSFHISFSATQSHFSFHKGVCALQDKTFQQGCVFLFITGHFKDLFSGCFEKGIQGLLTFLKHSQTSLVDMVGLSTIQIDISVLCTCRYIHTLHTSSFALQLASSCAQTQLQY